VKGNMTGEYADGPAQNAPSIDAAMLSGSSLTKINCEGGEYSILESLIESGEVRHHENLQVQFHTVAPDWLNRYKAIHEGLKQTHMLTYDAPFCWQNWELR
jgi:hypothetical protein